MPKGKKDLTVAERLVAEAKSRLKEVDEQIGPLQSEKQDLEGILNTGTVEVASPAPEAPAAAQPKPQRRSRKGGTRHEQAVALIRENPEGISASEIAKVLKVKPNYMYRVLSGIVKDGEAKKDGRSYQPA